MLKNVFISILAVTLILTMGIVIFKGSEVEKSSADTENNAAEAVQPAEAVSETSGEAPAAEVPVAPNQQGQSPQQNPLNASTENVGEPWLGTGTIESVDDFGLTLQLTDGSQVYIELGPPSYWQAQGISLFAGEIVTVNGFAQDNQYHARLVIKADGTQLTLRNETGQPMWSGGAQGEPGTGAGVGQVQIPVEEWETVEGTITAVGRNSITVTAADGTALIVQTGNPTFLTEQGITFAVEEVVSLKGFWKDGQFQAGMITKTLSGEMLLLRDPNGRPLWAGPGRGQGNGNGNGTGIHPTGTPDATTGQ